MHFSIPVITSALFWASLWKIIVANVILSGDNAVVIALASHNLEEKYRRPAILLGSLGAIVMLIAFCALVNYLLTVPYLKLVGGLLLLWIGIKLLAEEEEEGSKIKAHGTLLAAVGTISLANTVMSLDNAIAMAAAAHGDMTMIAIGLVVSVPVIMLGASIISTILDRFPWVAVIGAGLIGWIAGDVMASDGRVDQVDAGGKLMEVVTPGSSAAWLDALIPHAEEVCGAFGAGLVLVIGLWVARRKAASSASS
ncbi:integral membrane protein, YjbE family [Enhydrobacter aerosaccus]|uniref:Integral membrane protein, YjbE family n=1 Tax=Enhydrobacter aerosaccus TaxID=225324 RepID=A0A1T4THY3_9HYPH|nr:YjbE family putative metal transport protein [Enhydrobacter aerosaccus]SKA39861.1 integral membrane protein, YjbE family [Enhydrobacter aerosaccus]